MAVSDSAIREEILKQIKEKRSTAPRDVAQALAGEGDDWRKLLPRIRLEATRLYEANELAFIRKKKQVSPSGLKGVYRLAVPQPEGEAVQQDTVEGE